MYALAAALLSIAAYLWFRFEWQFGLSGVLSLLHDVIAIVGVFALLGYEFNLTIVAAILTIAGYSINDSVVVFDRIRENMRKYKTMPFIDLIDLSINQTLSRTFITGLTTIIVLIVLYVLGGEVLRGFSFAMLFGVIIGTYSSVFVAVPLLLYLDVRRAPVRRGGDRPRTGLSAAVAAIEITPKPAAGRQLIESYGGGGFRVAGLRHSGSVVIFPRETVAWPVANPADISLASLQPVVQRVDRARILIIGCGRSFAPRPRGSALRAANGRNQSRVDGHRRGLPHIQCASARGPGSRGGVDRGGLGSMERDPTRSGPTTTEIRPWSGSRPRNPSSRDDRGRPARNPAAGSDNRDNKRAPKHRRSITPVDRERGVSRHLPS